MILAYPDNKVHGADMGPIWGRQQPGGPHVGPMDFAIRVVSPLYTISFYKAINMKAFPIPYIPRSAVKISSWNNRLW